MSIDKQDHTNYTHGTRSYRYYYQSGSADNPTAGHSRGFDDEWAAFQYMDDEREHSQRAADESGEPIVDRVVDMDDGSRVLQFEVIRPRLQEASRPTFSGHGRPALTKPSRKAGA